MKTTTLFGRGVCTGCGHDIALNKDGTVRRHRTADDVWCAGSRQVPAESELTPEQQRANEQAAGLRALANFMESNPHLAKEMDYPLGYILVPVNNAKDPRAMLADFGMAANSFGAELENYRGGEHAGLLLKFGSAVRLQVYAKRDTLFARYINGVLAEQYVAPDNTEWRVPAELAALGVTS